MNLTADQELIVADVIRQLGATGNLLNEMTDHWCVQVQLEMSYGSSFSTALKKVQDSQSAKAKELITEMEQLRFPYTISRRLVNITGVISIILLATGFILRVLHFTRPVGLLLPGYILTAYVFLPIWFLRRLHTRVDKVNSTLLFLSLLSFTHLFVLWLNHAPSRWIALSCWIVFLCSWLLNWRRTHKNMY